MGLLVLSPGAFTTVQDRGRPGYRSWGVPIGGCFDQGAADLANALLGNFGTCAVLELTLLGGLYEAQCPVALAIAGAPMEATVASSDGSERSLQLPLSFSLQPRERLRLGAAREGARAYLAVGGGWLTPAILESRSSETRLKAGEIVPARSGTVPVRHIAEELRPVSPEEPLRIINGPDARHGFDHAVWERAEWRAGPRSDRMGIRLEGPRVAISAQPDRLSAPVLPGAVQVAGGQLIVLGVACGTMGGYPHVAQVISADLDRLGQVRPGDVVRFRRVTLEEARDADMQLRLARARFLTRIRTGAEGLASDPAED